MRNVHRNRGLIDRITQSALVLTVALAPSLAPPAAACPQGAGAAGTVRAGSDESHRGTADAAVAAALDAALDGDVADAALDELAQRLAPHQRREAIARLLAVLCDPGAAAPRWRRAARLAVRLPDPALAEPLLDRIAALSDAGVDRELLPALRAALDVTRRRWLDLEVERLATGSGEVALQALDHFEARVRAAAWTRMIELVERPEALRAELRERIRVAAAAAWAGRERAVPAGEAARAAELLANLAPGEELAREIATRFAIGDAAERKVLLPALRAIPVDRGGREVAAVVAVELSAALQDGNDAATAEWRATLVETLRPIADLPELELLENAAATLQPEPVRTAAVAALSELGRRTPRAEIVGAVVPRLATLLREDRSAAVRFAAVLGLGQLQDVLIARSEKDAPEGANEVILATIFAAVEETLPRALGERTLVEPCVRTLWRSPGRAAAATAVLSRTLLEGAPSAPVREALLSGLKELGHEAGLSAILASLPPGGPTAEADAVGKAAYAALLALLRVAAEAGRSLDVELSGVDGALACERPAWAAWLAARQLEQLDRYDEAEPQHRIRLAFAAATLAQGQPTQYLKAYEQLEWVALQAQAPTDRGHQARRLLLDLAERIGPALAADAELYGTELLRELVDSGERGALCLRIARLQFAAGAWEDAYRWLDREHDEVGAPLEVVLLKARAAARREDADALRDALRLHELLLGTSGRGGGRLPADSPQRIACELALAGLLHDAGREADARALLAVVPAVAELAPELQSERRRVEERLRGSGGP